MMAERAASEDPIPQSMGSSDYDAIEAFSMSRFRQKTARKSYPHFMVVQEPCRYIMTLTISYQLGLNFRPFPAVTLTFCSELLRFAGSDY